MINWISANNPPKECSAAKEYLVTVKYDGRGNTNGRKTMFMTYQEKPSLEDKKDEILDALVENYLENDEDLYNATWVEIRKSYNLEINDSTIENGYNAIIKRV